MENQSGTLAPGTVIQGPKRSYTVIKVLGQGGFGITYLVSGKIKVDNIVVEARFALKEHFISSLCSRDGKTCGVEFSDPVADEVGRSLRAFIKEAKRLQSLGIDHPNIVRINEVFEANNTAYYVMEYLGSTTLSAHIARTGALSPEAAKSLLRPVVEAVAMLHRNSIAHYDIKPGNIMLHEADDGILRPVLIDFGLSKHYDNRGHATSTIAAAGFTPGYAPSEQYAGIKEFTPQCDVYALAATFYFCVTGRAPKPALELRLAEVGAEMTPILGHADTAALLRALAIFPEGRPRDASLLLAELFTSAPTERIATPTAKLPPVPSPFDDPADKETLKIPATPSRKHYLKMAAIIVVAVIFYPVTICFLIIWGIRVLLKKHRGTYKGLSSDLRALQNLSLRPVLPFVRRRLPLILAIAIPLILGAAIFLWWVNRDTTTHNSYTPYVLDETATTSVVNPVYTEITPSVGDSVHDAYFPPAEGPEITEVEMPEPTPTPRQSYENLDLYATRDGKDYFFSKSEWKSLSSAEKSKYNRKGVVVIGKGLEFVLALHDSRNEVNWKEAMYDYGDLLPSMEQGEIIATRYKDINSAMITFGGDELSEWFYWTKTTYEEDSSHAWIIAVHKGHMRINEKKFKYVVRKVTPLPDRS